MKNIILASIICTMFMSFGMAQEKGNSDFSFNNINPLFTLQEKFDLDNLEQMTNYNSMIMKEITFSNTVQIVLSISVLIFAFFVIIITPLTLIYCWLNNLFEYRKYHTKNNISYSELYDLPKHVFLKYKRTYSNLLGNGFGIVAWTLSSYFYVTKNIDGISVGLAEYFSFPFKLLSNTTIIGITTKDNITFEVLISILLIIAFSFILFFLGRRIGSSLADTNYYRYGKLEDNPQVIITN